MKEQGWDRVILSDPRHEHLIAEIYYEGRFIALLDREDGPEAVHVTLQENSGGFGIRILLADLLMQLQQAQDDLIA